MIVFYFYFHKTDLKWDQDILDLYVRIPFFKAIIDCV